MVDLEGNAQIDDAEANLSSSLIEETEHHSSGYMEGNDETLAKEKEGFVVDEEHIFGGNLERPIVQAKC